MLSVRTDLRKQLAVCTLQQHLRPAALFKNDISLMNFPARITAACICCNPVPCFGGPNVPRQFCTSLFQSFIYRCQTPFGNSRFVWDCKGRKLFLFRKKKIIYFLSLHLLSPCSSRPLISAPFLPKRSAKVAKFSTAAIHRPLFFQQDTATRCKTEGKISTSAKQKYKSVVLPTNYQHQSIAPWV